MPATPYPTRSEVGLPQASGRNEGESGQDMAEVAWVTGRLKFQRWAEGRLAVGYRSLPEEMPTAIVINGAEYAVMLASPSDLTDFAYGFLLSERLISSTDAIESVNVRARPQGIQVDVQLFGAHPRELTKRRLPGISGCGLCGVESLEQIVKPMPRLPAGHKVDGDAIIRAIADLPGMQRLNQLAGAMHAAAFARIDGSLVCAREDVGRHNALDKLIGALMQGGSRPADGFVVMSSRCSYELVQKAAAFGITLLATVSAPTAMAVRLAREANVSLVAQVRGDSFLVLAGSQRVVGGEETSDG